MAFLGDDFLVMPFDLLELFFSLANFAEFEIKYLPPTKRSEGWKGEQRSMLCLSKAKNKYESAVTY